MDLQTAEILSEEESLISACKKEDRIAQERLYKKYYHALMTICLRYTRDEQDAVYILNQGFLKIFQHIHTYNAQLASLYTWMQTIVVRTALDWIKANQKWNNHKTELNDDNSDSAVNPSIYSKLDSNDILKIIQQLPPTTRTVFNMYVFEGFTHAEIGKQLNISDGTSKWHVSDARNKIKQILKTWIK